MRFVLYIWLTAALLLLACAERPIAGAELEKTRDPGWNSACRCAEDPADLPFHTRQGRAMVPTSFSSVRIEALELEAEGPGTIGLWVCQKRPGGAQVCALILESAINKYVYVGQQINTRVDRIVIYAFNGFQTLDIRGKIIVRPV